MNIVSAKSWGMKIRVPLEPLDLKKVNALALHHMAHPTADIYEVERWHLNQGWRAFGYNFWVGFDGKIHEGRSFNIGAGVENQNNHIISIGLQGDYHSKPFLMPDVQFNAGIDIINYVKSKVPSIKVVGGHKDFMATACPGRYFPLEEMQKGVKRLDKISADYTVDNLIKDGIITVDNMANWEKYLDGRESPIPPEYVRALLDRYHNKLKGGQ